MDKAKQLVEESGTKGKKVDGHLDARRDDQGDRPLLRLAAATSSATRRRIKTLQPVRAVLLRPGLAQQGADLAHLLVSRLHRGVELPDDVCVGCDGFRPTSTSSPNLSEFCDQEIQAKTEQALKLAQTDPDAANALWAEVDKDTTDQAPLVSLFVSNRSTSCPSGSATSSSTRR